jgi:hypothetical protein
MEENIIIGAYLKVKLPPVVHPKGGSFCEHCRSFSERWFKFCPDCGNKTKTIQAGQTTEVNISDFCREHLGDEYLFRDFEENGWRVVYGNGVENSGLFLMDFTKDETLPMPPDEFTEDWQRLMAKLDEQGIEYQKHYGIIRYFNW